MVLLFCCSLAGTEEAKQALQAKLPNCDISVWQDSDSDEDEDEDSDEDEDEDQDED
jgi:hypothetical protein